MAAVTIDAPQPGALSFLTDNAISSLVSDTYNSLSERRKLLGLTNPGSVEGIAREVQRDVLLTNHMFSGLRCDLQKFFSISPMFRMQHGLAMGSNVLPPWQLLAMYGNSRMLLQGTFSSDQTVQAIGNIRWTPRWVTRTQTQIDPRSPQSVLQVENEYHGDDFSASVKLLNPSIMEGGLTAIVIGDYMQAITSRFAVGLEGVWQRPSMGQKPETAMSYAARYKTPEWIASAQLHATGQLGASYWRRLSDKLEAGVDCQLQFAPGMGGAGMFGGMRKEGQTTVGVKYNFLTSVYRAQIDSTGKVGCVLEKRIAPSISINFAAEIDQWKNTHKLGLGVSLEGSPEELDQKMQDPALQNETPPPY